MAGGGGIATIPVSKSSLQGSHRHRDQSHWAPEEGSPLQSNPLSPQITGMWKGRRQRHDLVRPERSPNTACHILMAQMTAGGTT